MESELYQLVSIIEVLLQIAWWHRRIRHLYDVARIHVAAVFPTGWSLEVYEPQGSVVHQTCCGLLTSSDCLQGLEWVRCDRTIHDAAKFGSAMRPPAKENAREDANSHRHMAPLEKYSRLWPLGA